MQKQIILAGLIAFSFSNVANAGQLDFMRSCYRENTAQLIESIIQDIEGEGYSRRIAEYAFMGGYMNGEGDSYQKVTAELYDSSLTDEKVQSELEEIAKKPEKIAKEVAGAVKNQSRFEIVFLDCIVQGIDKYVK